MAEDQSGIPDDGLPYSEQERAIFRYEAGGEPRLADPMALTRRINRAQRELGNNLVHAEKTVRALQQAEVVDLPSDMVDEYYEALGQIAAVALAGFGVPHVEDDPSGWTEAEAIDALYRFYDWMAAAREDFPSTPSSATSSASAPTGSVAATAPASPTGPSSGSGSTPSASARSTRRRTSSAPAAPTR